MPTHGHSPIHNFAWPKHRSRQRLGGPCIWVGIAWATTPREAIEFHVTEDQGPTSVPTLLRYA